jgi:hypothetical protein
LHRDALLPDSIVYRRQIALEYDRRRVDRLRLAGDDSGEESGPRILPKLKRRAAVRRARTQLAIRDANGRQNGWQPNHGEL